MRVWIVLISLFFPQLVSAQFSLDSLRHIWLNESNPDSIRLNAMNRMVEHGYIRSYLDTFKHYNNQYIDLAIKANSKKHWSRGLMGIAVYHLNMNNTMEGVIMLDSAQKMARQVNYTYGIEGVNSVFGIIKIFQGDQSGVDMCQQAYERFVELDDLMGMVNSASFLSRAYGIIGDNKQCFYYAKVSLEHAKDLGNWSFLGSAYHVMADVYLRLGIHEQGDVLHEKALEFCRKGNYIGEEMLIYGHIAGIAFNNGEYDIALKELLKVETFNLASNNPFQAQSTNAKIIYLYASTGNVAEAKTRISKYEKNEIKGLQSKGNTAFVNAAKGMLLALEEKYEESNAILIATSKVFAATNQNINEIRAYKTLIQNFKKLGNYKQAVLYHEKLDSINANEKEKALIQNVQKFELHRLTLKDSLSQVEKDRIVEKNHKDELDKKNKAKNLAIGSGFILLLLAGAFYSRFLYVRKAKSIIEKEKHRSDELLLNILPAEIAEELKNTGESEAQHFDQVSILFTDFKEFTQIAETLSAKELVNEINTCFKAFDHICDKYGIEKIKTIGDSYMAAAGLKSNVQGPMSTSDIRLWTQDTTLAALEMQRFMTQRNKELETRNSSGFKMRCGIHTGPVVAGIVGVKKFQYDIWGDTVNTASRMESHGEVGKVNISEATYNILTEIERSRSFKFEEREEIEVKGKGKMEMFFVELID